MGRTHPRSRGAALALAACAMAVGMAAALAERISAGPSPESQAPRDEARLCRIGDDAPAMLI